MRGNAQLDDQLLFERIAAGDEAAFRLIFDAYRLRLYALALKMLRSGSEAQEIVQETFLSLWTSREKLPAVTNASSYIFTIAYHKIYRQLKQTAIDARKLQALIAAGEISQNSTEENMAARESQHLVAMAVQQLSPQRKQVYLLSRGEGLTLDEIAVRMGVSRNTVKNHLVEALKQIRTYLKKGSLRMFSTFMTAL